MRAGGSFALIVFVVASAVSTAAQQETGATSAAASISAIGAASGPSARASTLAAVRVAVEPISPDVHNDNLAPLPQLHSDSYWYGRFGYGAIDGNPDESTGVPRAFDETSLRKIRLLYSPKHDALVGLGTGAALGAFGVYVSAGLGGCFSPTGHTSDCHVLEVTAAVGGGLGAAIGMTIGAFRYPFNNAFDVYRGDARGASSTNGHHDRAAGREGAPRGTRVRAFLTGGPPRTSIPAAGARAAIATSARESARVDRAQEATA